MTINHGVRLVIEGVPPAKSNSYRIVGRGRYHRLVPTSAVVAYEELVAVTAQTLVARYRVPVLFPHPRQLEVAFIWYRNNRRRADLDNIAKALNDGLTKGGLWGDDRQIVTLQLTQRYEKGIQEHVVIYVSPLEDA